MFLPHQSRAFWFSLWGVIKNPLTKHPVRILLCVHVLYLPSPAPEQSTVKWVGSFALSPLLSTPGPNTLTLLGWLPFPTFTCNRKLRSKVTKDVFSCANLLYNTVKHFNHVFIVEQRLIPGLGVPQGCVSVLLRLSNSTSTFKKTNINNFLLNITKNFHSAYFIKKRNTININGDKTMHALDCSLQKWFVDETKISYHFWLKKLILGLLSAPVRLFYTVNQKLL